MRTIVEVPNESLGGILDSVVNQIPVDELIKGVAPHYARLIRPYQPWLEQQGRMIGKRAILSASGKARGALNLEVPPAPGPHWVDEFLNPVIDPLVAGLQQELEPVAKKAVAGVVGVAVAGALTFFLLGRWSKG